MADFLSTKKVFEGELAPGACWVCGAPEGGPFGAGDLFAGAVVVACKRCALSGGWRSNFMEMVRLRESCLVVYPPSDTYLAKIVRPLPCGLERLEKRRGSTGVIKHDGSVVGHPQDAYLVEWPDGGSELVPIYLVRVRREGVRK